MPPPYLPRAGQRRPEEPKKEEVLKAGRELAAERMKAVDTAYDALRHMSPDTDPVEQLGKVNDLKRAVGAVEEVAWVAAILGDEPARVIGDRTGYTAPGARMSAIGSMSKLIRDGHEDVVPDSYRPMTKKLRPSVADDFGQSL